MLLSLAFKMLKDVTFNISYPKEEDLDMAKNQICKQMMEFHKTVFDNTFSYMATLQEQNEKIAQHFLEKLSWFPEEGRKAFAQNIDSYKKRQEDFKAKALENYKKVDECFVSAKNRE
jgi:hypothetical protein